VNSHVPLQVITESWFSLASWYLKSIASPSRPFHISIISRSGIFMAAAAAARSMLSISIGFSSDASSREVSVSEVKLGYFQEGWQAWKK